MAIRTLALLLLVGSLFIPVLAQPANAQQQLCFAETGQCIEGRIREFWEQNGGLPVFGLPVRVQQPGVLGDGRSYTVQWFEHNVCGDILAAWGSSGLELDGQGGISESESLALWGLPLSAPTVETLGDGRQYFVFQGTKSGHQAIAYFKILAP